MGTEKTKIERAWKGKQDALETWKPIEEETARKQLAHAHGDVALDKLKEKGELETRFAVYRFN